MYRNNFFKSLTGLIVLILVFSQFNMAEAAKISFGGHTDDNFWNVDPVYCQDGISITAQQTTLDVDHKAFWLELGASNIPVTVTPGVDPSARIGYGDGTSLVNGGAAFTVNFSFTALQAPGTAVNTEIWRWDHGNQTTNEIGNGVDDNTHFDDVIPDSGVVGNCLINDTFAYAKVISGTSGALTGLTNFGATKEAGEPNHTGNAGGASVWFTWTAPVNGSVTFDTSGSAFDTMLGIYTGSSVNALTEISANDDCGGIVNTSCVTFSIVSGKTYQIAVDGYNGGLGAASGAFNLNWVVTPAPVVSSSVRANPNPTSAASVNFTVTFSKSVTGVDAGDFSLTTTGVSGASVSGVSGSGTAYTVTVNTGTGSGNIRLDVVNDGTIKDAVLNPLDAGFTSGETYSVNKPAIFTDTPLSYWANSFIERLYNAGITGGCSTTPLNYCPDSTVTRAQMAVFLLKAMHGSSFTPPAVGGSSGFSDVATSYWAAAWIKQLAAEGITGGCGTGIFCPDATVTRAQMAVFLLKAKHGSSYSPPNATGVFSDVPVGYWADKWIERLAAEGVTSGCGTGIYCPDADVTRAQMAVFLVKSFNLP